MVWQCAAIRWCSSSTLAYQSSQRVALSSLGRAAMPRQLRHVHGVPGAGETLRDVAHLDRRAAEPVDQEEADAPSGKANALIHDAHSSSSLAPVPAAQVSRTGSRCGREHTRGALAGARPAVASHAARCAVTSSKSAKVACGCPRRAAVVGERALGDDVVGPRRHAEVGATVADHDARSRQPLAVRALAVGAADAAIVARSAGMPGASDRRPATRACWQRTGIETAAFFRAAPTTRSKPSETIFTSAPRRRQNSRKAGEARIDAHAADLLVELLGRDAQQLDLALHALARGDLAGLPRRLDHAPQRIGEALEQAVRGIVRRDGAVEIDENLPPRARGQITLGYSWVGASCAGAGSFAELGIHAGAAACYALCCGAHMRLAHMHVAGASGSFRTCECHATS